MDKEFIRRHLPEDPPEGMLHWALGHTDELGGDYMVFRGERVREPAPLEYLMENITVGKSIWAERCMCTACQEDFITRKVPHSDSFVMTEGEDGHLYPSFYDDEETGVNIEIAEGDKMFCPNCGADCYVISSKSVRGGRTKQVKVCTLQNVEGYTAIIYYMVWKRLDEDGFVWADVDPERAIVITERGGLVNYTHRVPGFMGTVPGRKWAQTSTKSDPWDSRYHDWCSAWGTKVGCLVYPDALPNMDGTTGEKTGLRAYFAAEGYRPLDYFKLWKRHRNLEQLVNTGGSKLIEDAIRANDPEERLLEYVDPTKRKPHQMLGLSKNAMKILKKDGMLRPDYLSMWNKYQRLGGRMPDIDFFRLMEECSKMAMKDALEQMDIYGHEPQKIFDYLRKQGLSRGEVGLLRDARRFARELSDRPLTWEQLWPKRLREAHDRLAVLYREASGGYQSRKNQEGFDLVLKKYGDIQWNDGELAVILPRNNGELVREGDTLRHCVGNYGDEHSSGERIILFIRHYRRPERCYYTLNIDFSGHTPREVQLHGYGNERHGPNKEYRHTIPQKVRNFVDRWEREIMLPWWRAQNKQKKERKTA